MNVGLLASHFFL